MLNISQLYFGYRNKPVLSNISCKIQSHDFVGIIGPNGVGKSTLIKCLSGFLTPDRGVVLLNQKPLHSYSKLDLAKQVSLVAQESYFEFDFKVRQVVLMGRFPYLKFWQSYSKQDIEIVDNILEELKICSIANRNLSELSGGEFQLVMIARAFVQDCPILLFDEPASHLDIHHQIKIFSILKKLNIEKKKTIIAVSHNINLAAEYCDKILVMKDGTDEYFDTVDAVMQPKKLSHVFQTPLTITENPFTGKPMLTYNYFSNSGDRDS